MGSAHAAKLEIGHGMFQFVQSHEPLLPQAGQAIERISKFARPRHGSEIEIGPVLFRCRGIVLLWKEIKE